MRNEAFIEVNIDEFQNKNQYKYLISVFVKFDAIHSDFEAVERFLDFKERLIDTLFESVIYVGMRVEGGWSEFYFYAKESKGFEQKVAAIFSQSGYVFETSIIKDAKWDFYYKNLFPNELEMFLIYSKKIVLQMMEEGDDLSHPREVEHYVSFDTASQKERFLKEIKEVGFTYKDDIDDKELSHAVAITKKHALDQDSLQDNINALLQYIKKNHGRYELWSAPLAQ